MSKLEASEFNIPVMKVLRFPYGFSSIRRSGCGKFHRYITVWSDDPRNWESVMADNYSWNKYLSIVWPFDLQLNQIIAHYSLIHGERLKILKIRKIKAQWGGNNKNQFGLDPWKKKQKFSTIFIPNDLYNENIQHTQIVNKNHL